jgi:hypothetical protein
MAPRRRLRWGLCGVLLVLAACAPRAGPTATPAPAPGAEAKVVRHQPDAGSQPAVADAGKKTFPDRSPLAPALLAQVKLRPAQAQLEPGDAGVQLMVEGPGRHGGIRDLTSLAHWEALPPGVVAVGPEGYVKPLSAGEAKVRAELPDGLGVVEAQVKVAAQEGRAWNFAEDVVPIFTRLGCNAGGCHGRAEGQNGFHLSLFGYDPEGDLRALAREGGSRRMSFFDPDSSLFLQKATGRTPHVGGQRLVPGSEEYRLLRSWIAAGAPFKQGTDHGSLVAVRVEPENVLLDEPGPQQLRVVARYTDGHERDVTRLARFVVNDETTATIDERGKATLSRRAETDLIVRYRSSVLTTRLATLINPDLSFDFTALARKNFVDEELFRRLEALRVPPSPLASDAAFLRRLSLDLTGEQPDTEQIRRFLADADPDKRLKLIDQLMASPDFVRFWEIKFGDMLQINVNRVGAGAYAYETWLHNRLSENVPWDVIVRTLLTALGKPTEGPVRDPKGGPANYALDAPEPKERAEQAAQRFLGQRMRCAQCHDHPFDVWTQDDYFGLAAIFAKVEFTGAGPRAGGMMGEPTVRVNPEGEVEHLRTKRAAEPRLLDGTPVKVGENDDPRKVLADWITAPNNPFFARATANWVWAQFFGKGIADPPDDLSRSNPPVHKELLDALARHFVAHKFDLRELIRTIVSSEAYGLSSATVLGNEHDTRLFSHHLPRPLTAHQMADALAQATSVPNRFANRGPGTRAIEVTDPTVRNTILDTFGRCPRTNGCAATTTPALSLRQALLLLGGDVVDSKVSSLNGYLAGYLALNPAPDELVENLYLRTLCRKPNDVELEHWTKELKSAKVLQEAAEDLFWALLNSREFAFNH